MTAFSKTIHPYDTVVAAVDTPANLRQLADAICDGTADQTEINAALAALPANGGTVLLLAGSYSISAAIAVPTNGWLRGEGVGTRITLANASNCDCITNDDWTTGNQNVRVSDLYLNGNRANQTSAPAIGDGPGQSLITFCNVQGGSIKNIVGTGGFLHGIDLTVRDIVDNSPNADVTKDIVVDTVEFSDFGDDGVTTHWVTGVTITNAVCHDSAATYSASSNGIEIDDGSTDVMVSNSTCYSNVSGFRVQGHTGRTPACNVSFTNCLAYDNSASDYTAAYQTPRGAFDPKGVSFTNCIAKSLTGIIISDYSEVTIQGCVFINSVGLDFRSYDDTGTYKARDVLFSGNTIIGNETLPGYGVSLLTATGTLTGNGVVISDNSIVGTRYSAINVENTRNEVTITGNVIRDCGKNLGGSTSFVISVNSSNVLIANNMLLENARGIMIGASAGNVKIIGNHIEHTGATTGIRIDGDEVEIVGNTIQCAQYAIHLPTSTTYTRLLITNNILTGSKGGNSLRNDASLDYATSGIIVRNNIYWSGSAWVELAGDTWTMMTDLDANGNTIHFGTAENEATIATGTNPNTCTVNLGAENHWTIPANDANNPINATITIPPGPCAGRILIEQGATPRDITWTPSAGTVAWLGTEPTWTDASEASEIHAVSWTWNGTYLLLSDAGKTSITP